MLRQQYYSYLNLTSCIIILPSCKNKLALPFWHLFLHYWACLFPPYSLYVDSKFPPPILYSCFFKMQHLFNTNAIIKQEIKKTLSYKIYWFTFQKLITSRDWNWWHQEIEIDDIWSNVLFLFETYASISLLWNYNCSNKFILERFLRNLAYSISNFASHGQSFNFDSMIFGFLLVHAIGSSHVVSTSQCCKLLIISSSFPSTKYSVHAIL